MGSQEASLEVPLNTLARLHADVDRGAARLRLLHAARLRCRIGCSSCCVDDLTVFQVEAERIRRHHAELLAAAVPHSEGGCAFLDQQGACRIYGHRPYVCRTQGLPLRWFEERDGVLVELRDICPLNDAGEPVEYLSADACWSVGSFERRLAQLQLALSGRPHRVRLRELFARKSAR